MDSQSHCAVGLAVPEEQIEQSIYDVLISNSRNEPIKLTEILWQISDRLELAPASIDLSAFEQQMTGIPERECCLKDALQQLAANYDCAVIDCPPAVGLLTFNALRAATDVVVPVETGYFSLHGLSKQLETLNMLCERSGQHVNVRVLASMYDIRTKMAREILGELRSHFADKMFRTTINFNTTIKEASSFGQPINEYNPASKGHRDFSSLAEEIIASETTQPRHDLVKSLTGELESISATADELLEAAKPAIKAISTPPGRRTRLREPELALVGVQTAETATAETPQTPTEAPETPTEALETPTEALETPTEALETPTPADTDAKLSDYYGANQMNDALVFVTLYPRADAVQIAGDFNNWQPVATPMEKVGDSGVWQTKLQLPRGTYRYRLVVDGQWQQDPYNEQTEMNPFGEYNSVVEVK